MFGKKRKEKRREGLENNVNPVKEMQEEELDQVSGSGNPFDRIQRVPNQSISDSLREKA